MLEHLGDIANVRYVSARNIQQNNMCSLFCVRLQSALLRLGIFAAIRVVYINISAKGT